MFDREYKAGPEGYAGKKAGTVLKPEDLEADPESLAAAGHIEMGDPNPEPCPACKQEGLKRVPKFDNLNDLREHYIDKHPAYAPPVAEG